ncbi:Molybdenum cofactor sulfurase-like, partial [Homarus americanus]
HCYLDHAAATLYSDSQIKDTLSELQSSLLGNPHSRHFPSDTSTQLIESVRQRILEHFNTTAVEYDVIFTSGATEALKIVAENFQWNGSSKAFHGPDNDIVPKNNSEEQVHQKHPEVEDCSTDSSTGSSEKQVIEASPGAFVYVRENHTSVLGMRGLAHQAGAEVYCLPYKEALEIFQKAPYTYLVGDNIDSFIDGNGRKESTEPPEENEQLKTRNIDRMNEESFSNRRNCLFTYSGQCNFSGAKGPLEWIEQVQNGALNDFLKKSPINDQNSLMKANTSDLRWFVLLDAAGLSATCPLDLSRWQPDFVPVSFYKIFGYPTGLGCLLVRNTAWQLLNKSYYGGGTVLMVDSRQMVLVPRPRLHDRFEDGTLPYLSILAIRHGLDTVTKLTGGMGNIQQHVFHLARYTHHALKSYRHANGSPVARLYSEEDQWDVNTHGSIVNFNLLNSDGSYVGYAQVERVASLYNIYLRTGCLCNPGACQTHLDISQENLLHQYEAGHVCGDAQDLVDGLPTGSVRVSFGYMSSYKDADLLLKMVRECFVDGPLMLELSWMKKSVVLPSRTNVGKGPGEDKLHDGCGNVATHDKVTVISACIDVEGLKFSDSETDVITERSLKLLDSKYNSQQSHNVIDENEKVAAPCVAGELSNSEAASLTLTDIIIYPVKSCAGFKVQKWNISLEGLKYDRQWMIVTSSGVTLTQKRLPLMSLITPHINLEAGTLTLAYKGEMDVSVPLEPPVSTTTEMSVCGGRVCGDRVRGLNCGPKVGSWLSQMLGQPHLQLMQQMSKRTGKLESDVHGHLRESLSLVNESQYLVLHRPSVRKLILEIQRRGLNELTEDELLMRFRGNIVVDGGDPYEEDTWSSMAINDLHFQIQGGCRRCQMVCVVPDTGERTREPMLTLSATRGSSMKFGVHAMTVIAKESTNMPELNLFVGAPVVVYTSNIDARSQS